ncbi:MAG: hypothetical protein GY795_28025 [Desulfobacterales bacterium]|nr:hypothetical protein [Desulfobacterales bacterium]
MQNDSLIKPAEQQRVLIYPGLAETGVPSRQVFFLFSVTQVEDIINHIPVHTVPFSPPYIEGIAEWRDFVVPVISLEGCLGFETQGTISEPRINTRLIMVRTSESTGGNRSILRAIQPIRMLSLPFECTPVSYAGWFPSDKLIRAVYEWEKGYLVVVHIDKILRGTEK